MDVKLGYLKEIKQLKFYMEKVIHKLNRIKKRFKYAFNFRRPLKWEYESCNDCGCNYRFFYELKQDIWDKIVGDRYITLCLYCLEERAAEKDTYLNINDFKVLKFIPKD